MKKISIILSIIVTLGILSGCEDLKYNEVSMFDEKWILENQGEIDAMIGVIYAHVRHGLGNSGDAGINGAMLASATDEADYANSLSTIHRYNNGAWSVINAFSDTWTNSYSGINQANIVLEKLDKIFAALEEYKHNTILSQVSYDQLVKVFETYPYQARFLRAYFHFELARTYGNVPLLTRTVTPKQANELKPSSAQEIFQFIVDECDAVKEFLPVTYGDIAGSHIGRINRPTALALKARTLLYAASPLFQPANPKEAWRKAAVASKEIIDFAPNWDIELCANYPNLWSGTSYFEVPELIWFRGAGNTREFARYNYPVGFEVAQGGNCPSQNLVDAYEYTSAAPAERRGKTFGEVNPVTIPANAYQNLDPRFGFTVAKNGDTWPTISPYNASPLETFEGGKSGPPIVNATTTGYYLKKYINGGNRLVYPEQDSRYTWITYRLAEFYLNYAEAMFNYMAQDANAKSAGNLDMSANDAINVLRSRPGINMPLFTETGKSWEQRYIRERMVELAFEGHRFWDIRRWRLADREDFSTDIKTVKVSRDGTVTRGDDIKRIKWDNKFYFYPIPFGELQKAKGLVQNEGW